MSSSIESCDGPKIYVHSGNLKLFLLVRHIFPDLRVSESYVDELIREQVSLSIHIKSSPEQRFP